MIEEIILGLSIFKKYSKHYLSCENNIFCVQVVDSTLMSTETLAYNDQYQLIINNWNFNKDLGIWEYKI